MRAALTDMMGATASYAHGMPINAGYISTYFTGEAAFKTTAAEQLKQIWQQKYFLNFMPVSYTHLDVYKRQILVSGQGCL